MQKIRGGDPSTLKVTLFVIVLLKIFKLRVSIVLPHLFIYFFLPSFDTIKIIIMIKPLTNDHEEDTRAACFRLKQQQQNVFSLITQD